MSAPNIDPEAMRDAYTCVGYALWHLQALEHSLVYYIVLRFRLKERGVAEEAERQFRIVKKFTMGNLLADLRDRSEVAPDLKERLANLVERRNDLAHRLFHDHHADLMDGKRARALASSMVELGDDALATNKIVGQLVDQTVLSWGVPESEYRERAAALFDSWADA